MLEMQRRLSVPFLLLLSLPATAMGFALAVQISVLSWLLSNKYGLDIHEIGLVWAAGPLAGIIGQVLIGLISDKVWFWGGRRRPFIIIGGVLSSLMLLALPHIGWISTALGLDAILGVAITVALALDLSINISFNPTRSIIADVTPEGPLRTTGYTWMQTVSGTFGVLAYGIGAFWGNMTLVYVAVGLVLVCSVLPALLIDEPKQMQQNSNDGIPDKLGALSMALLLRPLWAFLAYNLIAMGMKLAGIGHGIWLEILFAVLALVLIAYTLMERESEQVQAENLAGFRKVLAAHSLSWIGVQTMFVYMNAFVQQRFPEMSADETGKVLNISFLVLNAIAAITPALLLRPFALNFGQVRVHVFSLMLMALGYLAIYLFGFHTWVIYVAMGFMGIGWASIVSLPFAIMSQQVNPARIGLYMGLFNLSVVLPQLVVSLGIGLLISNAENKGIVFLIGAISVGASALAWFGVSDKRVATPVIASGGGH